MNQPRRGSFIRRCAAGRMTLAMRASSAVRLSLPTAHRSASTRAPPAGRPSGAAPRAPRTHVAVGSRPRRISMLRSHRTSPRVDRRGDVAVAHAAAATATAASVVPEIAIALSLGYLVASFVAFWWGASHPRSAAATFLRSPLPLVPLCVAYLALLCASWSPDTLSLMMPGSLAEGLATGQPQFFPRLDGIMTLLSRRVTAASAWLHIACINFFVGKVAATRAAELRIPVAHTLLLTSITGPIGLLSHWITQEVFAGSKARARRRAMTASETSPALRLVVGVNGGGILPERRPYGEGYGHGYGHGYGGGPMAGRVGDNKGGKPMSRARFLMLARLASFGETKK